MGLFEYPTNTKILYTILPKFRIKNIWSYKWIVFLEWYQTYISSIGKDGSKKYTDHCAHLYTIRMHFGLQ